MNEHSFIFASDLRVRDINKEQVIREKAVEMIVNNGFDGLSMQKLARAAGVSPATIYIYFKDRNDLIEQTGIESANALVNSTFKGFSPEMGFAEGMRIQWKNRADYYIKHPVQAKFLEQVKHSPVGASIYQKVKKEFSKVMKSFLENAIASGELAPIKAEIFWSVAFAPLYQLIKYHNDGFGLHHNAFELNDEILNKTLDVVLKGLKP